MNRHMMSIQICMNRIHIWIFKQSERPLDPLSFQGLEVDARFGAILFKGQAATQPKPRNEKVQIQMEALESRYVLNGIYKATVSSCCIVFHSVTI